MPIGTLHGRPVDGKKHDLTEGGSRVPLIANWPGVTPAGAVRKDLVDFSDMLPTFAELAGAKLPAEPKIDGHSFAPQLRGEKGQPREWAYVQLGERLLRPQRALEAYRRRRVLRHERRALPPDCRARRHQRCRGEGGPRETSSRISRNLAPSDNQPAKRRKKAK